MCSLLYMYNNNVPFIVLPMAGKSREMCVSIVVLIKVGDRAVCQASKLQPLQAAFNVTSQG